MKKLLLLAIIFVGSFLSGYAQCTQIQVTTTSPSPVSLCEGTAQSLTGKVLLTSAALTDGYTYSWIKISAGSSTVLVPPTPLNIPVNVNSSIDYTDISGALTDAGTYVLHVEDGTSGAGCYTEASIVVTVNPKPAITSASAGDACSGVAQNYEITSDIPSTYTWTRAVAVGLTNAAKSAQTTNPITETLVSSVSVSVVTHYTITPTATTGSCVGEAFTYDVTVHPKPIINSQTTGATCSGTPQNYKITNIAPSTYKWSRGTVTGITNTGEANQTSNTITEALTNTTGLPILVQYIITPTSLNGCVGSSFNYDVTVYPKPSITSAATETICSNLPQNNEITSDIVSTYTWTRAAVTGITNAARSSGTENPIVEKLTNSATTNTIVRYIITPTSLNGCVGDAFTYDLTIYPKPTITSVATGTICSGTPQNYGITSNMPSTFYWTRAAVADISNPAESGTTNLITEALTTTVATTTIVRYIITPTSLNGCTGTPFNYDVTVANEIPPAVSITSNMGTTICAGTSVTFKAIPTNGGTSPTYFWSSSINGALAATTDTYTNNNLVDGEVITVSITSNSSCAMPKIATNAITMHVLPELTPTVSITSDKTSICSDDPVVFTATPAGTGITSPAPSYKWYIGNILVPGETNATFITSSLTDPMGTPATPGSNQVHATIVSNAACANNIALSSSTISITVNRSVLPGSISSGSSFCSGATPDALTELTASDALSPSYVWEQSVNPALSAWAPAIGTPSGSDFIPQGTYTSDIYFRRTVTDASASAACNTATSNIVHITVLSPLAAGTISNNETICVGTIPSTITETDHTTGGTGIYTYQWESSLQSGGPYTDITNETNSSYSPDVLNHTMYFRRIETSGSCGSVYSNEVAKTVAPTILPTVTIDDPGATCNGDIVLLKCKATNMGSAPVYNWYVNGTIIAVVSNSFTTDNLFKPLKNGDEVWVELISNSSCANGSTVISNKVIVDLVPCTVSNSVYTTNNVEVLLQQYVSQSIPNSIDYTYLWSITGGFISTNVITGSNQISSGQQNVVYNVPFQSGITYAWTVTGGTITNGQGTNAITVDWDNVTGIAMARTTAPSYSVSVTETNQANVSKTTTMDLNMTTTAITTSLAQSGIQFYPNPSTDAFNIVMPQSGTLVHYSITDLSGMSVASGTFTSTGGAEKIITNFNTGLYQVVLTYNETVTCLRLNKVQ